MFLKRVSIVGLAVIATACSSTDNADLRVNTLSNKVDKLTIEVSKLKAQQEKQANAIEQMKMAQAETNQRINNVAASYKK